MPWADEVLPRWGERHCWASRQWHPGAFPGGSLGTREKRGRPEAHPTFVSGMIQAPGEELRTMVRRDAITANAQDHLVTEPLRRMQRRKRQAELLGPIDQVRPHMVSQQRKRCARPLAACDVADESDDGVQLSAVFDQPTLVAARRVNEIAHDLPGASRDPRVDLRQV